MRASVGEECLLTARDVQVVQTLKDLVSNDAGSARAKEIVSLMYETALLTSGFDLTSPKNYAGMVYSMMDMALTTPRGNAAPASASETLEADQIIEEK